MPLDAVRAQPLAGTEGAIYPFWSPDSRSIAFFAGGQLMRLDIGSGLPRRLATVIAGHGGSWSSKGVILFARTVFDPLWQVPESGGEAVPVTKLETPPDGARIS